jgi:hypothetical protein
MQWRLRPPGKNLEGLLESLENPKRLPEAAKISMDIWKSIG